MLPGGELHGQQTQSLSLPWLASAGNIPLPKSRGYAMFTSWALPLFFFSFSSFFSCMAHCQLRFCAFFIRWFTEVMCHNRWHSRHCIRRRGVHVSDLDSAAGCGAPSRRMHNLLPEISAVCAMQRFDTLQTQLSARDLCDNASLFLMPKPGKGHIKYCAISERLSTGTKRSAHNNLR